MITHPRLVLPRWTEKTYNLRETGTSTRTGGGGRNYQEEMRAVRERQQQVAELKAKAAAIERKKKEEAEKARKNDIDSKPAKALKNTSVAKSQSSKSQQSSGYNPMQPWSSGSGSSYK